MTNTAHDLLMQLSGGVMALIGITAGSKLTESRDRKGWINDNRKEEFRELLDALTEEATALISLLHAMKSGSIYTERDEHNKRMVSLKIIKTRIYIAKDLKERGLYDEWLHAIELAFITKNYDEFDDTFERIRDWIIERAAES